MQPLKTIFEVPFTLFSKLAALLWLKQNPCQGAKGSCQQNNQNHKQYTPGESAAIGALSLGLHRITHSTLIGNGLVLVFGAGIPDMGTHIHFFAAFTLIPVVSIVGIPFACLLL